MILHAQAKHGKPGLPRLVFLHGFSGDCHEWQEVGEVFANYSRLYVDLGSRWFGGDSRRWI